MSDGEQSGKQPGENDLSSIHLNIADALQIQNISAGKQRYYVKLIGYLNNKSLVVSYPVKNDELQAISEGQEFLVRGFSDRKTFEFNADVISVCMTPYPHLHLSFPTQISVITMRGALRIRPNLGCSILSQNNALKLPAIIEDISTSGAKISAKKELGEVGDDVIINFRLTVDGEELSYNMISIIRNISSDTDSSNGNKVVVHGVQFIQPEGKERTALQNFICKFMVEGE